MTASDLVLAWDVLGVPGTARDGLVFSTLTLVVFKGTSFLRPVMSVVERGGSLGAFQTSTLEFSGVGLIGFFKGDLTGATAF